MAFVRPVYNDAIFGVDSTNYVEADDTYFTFINQFAGYVHSQYPSVAIATTGTSGTLLSNQSFTDTYYVAGSYVTRVDRYATEAETPNTSLVTDTYSRIRQIPYTGGLPTGDANNTQYPVYLVANVGGTPSFRSMTYTDFVDTFVRPVLGQFGSGTGLSQGGTYFMTTSASPSNGTIVSSTPAAVNSVANVAAYTSSGIPEATKQTTDTNYYIAKVEYPLTSYDTTEFTDGNLPLFFDSSRQQLRQYTAAEWAALLGPFLQYYLSGGDPDYTLSYNVDGADGETRGSTFLDTRLVPTGTGYTQRFVNADDYRTQEFPTGTTTTTVGSTKVFKMHQGPASSAPAPTETVSLEGTATTPERGNDLPLTDGSLTLGWRFKTDGTIEDFNADRIPLYSTTSHLPWINTTPTGTWYIRVTDITTTPTFIRTGYTSGAWHDITTSEIYFNISDSRAFASYGNAEFRWKVELSRNNDGTNIAATGYYRWIWEGGA